MTYRVYNVVYNRLFRFCVVYLQSNNYNIAFEMRLNFRTAEGLEEMCRELDAYIKNGKSIRINTIMKLYEYLRIGEKDGEN